MKVFLLSVSFLVSLLIATAALGADTKLAAPPDLTQSGSKDDKHDWLLGPTGARGWIYFRHEDLTAASRQILITSVDAKSPADGILRVKDVILGVFGKPFADDARRSFGYAITTAEEKTGILPLMLWRDGKKSNVELRLQVLGAYSATAPYDCPKSKAIFEQGCRLIAKKGLEHSDIPDHLNALALLASGDMRYHPMLSAYAKKVGASLQPIDTWNWYIAYGNLFLSEYAMASGKKSVLAELKETTMRGVKNQCMNGMWGHAPALPNGHSEGYGGMNQIGLPMTLSLVLARQAGVSDPALDKAIDKSVKFLRYYVDKGAIPYGDHPAWGNSHEDNGKSSCAAVLFDMLGDREAAAFFSWMATAAYDEREHGHCGNFWNMLWAIPGASRSGPLATGAYLKEQSWYYDLSRNWRGGFVYQKIEAGDENDNYTQWDLTGGYLLSFGLYQKSLLILGKKPSAAPSLNTEAVKKVIVAGRDRYPEGEGNGYFKRKDEVLLEGLKSWSPAMRYHSAEVIGKRDGDFAPTLLAMIESKDRYARYGAIEALGRLGKGASSALPRLRTALKDPDTWLQCLAAEALTRLGDKDSTGDLLAMSLRPTPADPRRMHQRAASRALFSPYPGNSEPRSILSDSLDGVDPEQLHLVMKSFLENEDSVVRASIIPALGKLSDRDLAVLLPDLVSAVEILAPTNEMWGDDIRQAGLDILSSRHIREGMTLCVSTMEWRWGNDYQKRLEYLKRYGGHAKEVLPLLRTKRPLQYPEGEKNIDKAIADIEASTDAPTLVSLKDFIAHASANEEGSNNKRK
ncbi:MAG: DUF6288 domain-containing protein [Verrucomicrobia bacterium]|nr:DUF6288 domain-containing protein [Verrucomicrobiota bacterium]